jgi:pimeloyl-ACP methyl ester carboxylesterase
LLMRLAVGAPWLGRATLAVAAAVAHRWPRRAEEWFLRNLPPADHAAARRHLPPGGPLRGFTEAFAQGAQGALEDYRILAVPWGFDVERVDAPIDLWHGDADTIVALRHAELLAERLPNARLRVLPGEGHLFPMERACELLTTAARSL